jgi:hypothetical protein
MQETRLDSIAVLRTQHRHLGEILREVTLAESREDRRAWLLDFTVEADLAVRLEQQLHVAINSHDTRLSLEEAAAERAIMGRLLFELSKIRDAQGEAFEELLASLQALFRGHVIGQERLCLVATRGMSEDDLAAWAAMLHARGERGRAS